MLWQHLGSNEDTVRVLGRGSANHSQTACASTFRRCQDIVKHLPFHENLANGVPYSVYSYSSRAGGTSSVTLASKEAHVQSQRQAWLGAPLADQMAPPVSGLKASSFGPLFHLPVIPQPTRETGKHISGAAVSVLVHYNIRVPAQRLY